MKKTQQNITQHKFISVKGARLHNLKNVDCDIPRNKLTVITGVSGSGKSSLAFDTIYAEGQRRFVESLSSYARQFLERMHKPEVDSIIGLPPAIAIGQNTLQKNPRSTVGTTTEIYDYLRILFARIGKTICYNCGRTVTKDSANAIVNELIEKYEGDRIFVLFQVNNKIRGISQELAEFKALGFFRVMLAGSTDLIDLNEQSIDESLFAEEVFILVDRLKLVNTKEDITRLTDSIESGLKNGNGKIVIKNADKNTQIKYSTIYECADCDIVFEEPEPRLFSFNSPQGACPKCQGFGKTIGIDDDLVIPDPTKSIRKNAIAPFKGETMSKYLRDLIRICPKYDIDVDAPYSSLTDEQKNIIWEGSGIYEGINGFFKMLEEGSYKMHYRIMLSRYRGYTKCKACDGSRMRTSARQVFIEGKNIPELVNVSLEKLYEFTTSIKLNDYEKQVAGQLLNEINWRLQLLLDIGLNYLTLSRLAHTLSGGESQRINLSTAIGSALVGTLYVLDEPSIGMHPRDTERLLKILFKLKNLGNTVLVVEHDPDIIRHADYIVDMGPLAGEHGGELVFSGTFDELRKSNKSLTSQYFSGDKSIAIPDKRRKGNGNQIVVVNATENNLKIDKVAFPLGCMVVVTGVSGSGKSSLVHDVLYSGIKKLSGNSVDHLGKFGNIMGWEYISRVEMVDQSSIGKSSRSTPATYTKVFDFIRDVFANTQAAKQLGWKSGHFSFNVPGGRCDACEGEGSITVDMQFLPDVSLECESCHGTRYKKEARAVLYNGKSIVDVLDMTIDEAAVFFEDKPRIANKLDLLRQVGLGYLKLGQPSSMLSGGESQRIKLAGHLDTSSSSQTLFIFDEPTTGLHLDDISKLLLAFQKIVDNGHSLIIIEHNLHVMAAADWIIDIGPEAGDKGGMVIATGTPEKIAKVKESLTGIALKDFFKE